MPTTSYNPEREKKLLLLADDSKTVRTLLSKVLDQAGYRYYYFENGQELLSFLQNNTSSEKPAAILLDVEMPVMTGPVACREIKRTLPDLKAPIIFFTSANSPNSYAQTQMVGGDEFLVKPFAPDKLLERIDHWAGIEIQEDAYSPDTAAKLVMFADDSKTMRLGVSKVLSEVGFTVEAFESGIELVEALDTHTPMLIILDLIMPDMSGFDTCKMIRRTRPELEVPILFFTSSVDPDNVSNARMVGGNDFVKKSLPPDVLVERVEYWSRQFQLEGQDK